MRRQLAPAPCIIDWSSSRSLFGPRVPARRHRDRARSPSRQGRTARSVAARRQGRRLVAASARRSPTPEALRGLPARGPSAVGRAGLRPRLATTRPTAAARNLGPTEPRAASTRCSRAGRRPTAELNGSRPTSQVPVDAVTASASGLDPDISVANARLQAAPGRRGAALPLRRGRPLVDEHTTDRTLGFLGERRSTCSSSTSRSTGSLSDRSREAPAMARGTLAHLPRRRARRRQDLRHAQRGPAPARAGAPTSSSGSSRPTAGPTPPTQLGDLEVVPRRAIDLPRHDVRGDGRRRGARPRARRSRWSTSSRTPTCPGRATRSAGRTSRSCSTPGIDVISTVNIQHLESLNDVVERITGVKQRETMPDDGRARAPTRSSSST